MASQSLGQSLCLSMKGSMLIAKMMDWADDEISEMSDGGSGADAPELDCVLLLEIESIELLELEIARQFGDFPHPPVAFVEELHKRLAEIRNSSPQLQNSTDGFGKPKERKQLEWSGWDSVKVPAVAE